MSAGEDQFDILGLSPAKRALLARVLAEEGIGAQREREIPIRERSEPLPLSYPQREMWFLEQLNREPPLYNNSHSHRLQGPLDVSALGRALNEIVRRHEVLRTNIDIVDGDLVQRPKPPLDCPLQVVDLRELPEPQRERKTQQLAAELKRQRFDLAGGRLFRHQLVRLADQDHVLLLVLHHTVTDHWSQAVLFRELAALYDAFRNGEPSPLPELPIQYADFAVWQRQRIDGELLVSQLPYWREQLRDLPRSEFPTDFPRPSVPTFRGAKHSAVLPDHLAEALSRLSRSAGGTWFMTLLAAFKVLFHRHTGQDDIVVGIPVAGRDRIEIEGLIGYFLNILVLRSDLAGNPSFRELLDRVQATTSGAFAHQEIPFEKVVEDLQPQRDLGRTPLFQAFFNAYDFEEPSLELTGISSSRFPATELNSEFDITLYVRRVGGKVRLTLAYKADLFRPERMAELLKQYTWLLSQIVADPDASIHAYSLLTEPELDQLIHGWNDTATDYPLESCIHELFEQQAEQTPDRVAVAFETQALTYRELNERANRLAHYLRDHGVGPETLVGLSLERSPELVIGILGILKAGGAYLPLDPDHPPQRLKFMLQDANIDLLVTQSGLLSHFSTIPCQVVCMDTDATELRDRAPTNPSHHVGPENLAYVMYTSGSTGSPKGVMVEHRSICNRIYWMQDAFHLTAADRVLQKTPFSFDVSVWEFLWPLLFGARLVLARPGGHQDPGHLLHLIREQQITHLHFVPSMLRLFLQQPNVGSCVSLQRVICSGEALSVGLQNRFHERLGAELHNLYGPTEAAVDVTHWPCQQHDDLPTVPIGKPISNTQIYILDSCLQPVPVGVPGELHIGGVQVSRGYWHRPELTAERFIADPFADVPGVRLYKTGDLCRYLPGGDVEFLGRIDDQVKIAGNRVEPGEIEHVLGNHSNIREVAVVADQDALGHQVLVAHLVPHSEPAPSVAELRAFVGESLPSYMVPSSIVVLPALPLTSSGKTDRRALSLPTATPPQLAAGYVAPRNPVEDRLANIWSECFGIEQVGINDNFFHLGGHSLLAISLLSRIQEEFPVDLPLASVFEAPTISRLAQIIENFPRQQDASAGAAPQYENEQPASTTTHSRSGPESVETTTAACAGTTASQTPELLKLERRPLLSLFAMGKIGPVDAVAFAYLSDQLALATDEGRRRVREAWCNDLPTWSHVVETSLGRIGIIRLPWFGSELYDDQHRLVTDACDALDLAGRIGARAVSLTGLIPSATEYGHAIAEATSGRSQLPVVTTGHASTVATVVLTIERILAEARRDLIWEHVGFLGLGSIGRSTLRLMLQCLPHPDRISLCDVYGNSDTLRQIQRELVERRGYSGQVRIIESRGHAPAEFYEASLIVGATNVQEVLDIGQLRPGTIIVDDSAPRCFSANDAIRRLQEQRDILFTEGGVLESPQPISLIRQCSRRAEELLTGELKKQLLHYNPYHITGCVLSSLLTARFDEIEPTLGIIDDHAALQVYKLLRKLEYKAADVHCRPHVPSSEPVAEFRARFGAGGKVSTPLPENRSRTGTSSNSLISAKAKSTSQSQRAPVSFTQERMLFLDGLQPRNPAYNISLGLRISGPLDVAALERAFCEIMRRHEILRTTFSVDSGQPTQVIHESATQRLAKVSLTGVAKGHQEAEVQRLAGEDARRPFDLTQGPLLRTTLLELGEQEHVLLLTLHHIITDGKSLILLLKELSLLYSALSAGEAPALARPSLQYQDYARRQRRSLESGELRKQISYWKRQLDGVPAQLELPTDRSRPKIQSFSGALESVALSKRLSDQLRSFSIREDATLFMLSLAAFKLLLHRYSRQDDIVVGCPAANRSSDELEGLVGYFANTLALRTDLSGHPTFRELLARVRRVTLEALEFQEVPLAELVAELQPERDFGRNPIYQVMFGYHEAAQYSFELPGLSVTRFHVHNKTSKVDLLFRVGSTDQGLVVTAEYDTTLFDTDTITRMLGHYQTLLESIIAEPDQHILDLPLLTEQEQRQPVVEWNDTTTDFPPTASAQQLFEAQVERTPSAVAVVFEDQQLTYRELNTRANQLASHLQTLGTGPGGTVGICLERSLETVIGLLGVLKAGAAYVPLDPTYPPDRLTYMVSDARIAVLVTHRQTADIFQEFTGQVVCLERDWQIIAREKATHLRGTITGDHSAYVIYTSGSTGRPKGVAVSHQALAGLLYAIRRELALTARDVQVAVASLSFDIATSELLLPLTAGAQVVLAGSDVIVNGHRLAALLAAAGGTVMQATPATWQMLLATGWTGQPQLKALCGGEVMPRELANSLLQRVGSLWNCYGPTETTIWSTIEKVSAGDGPVPIGRPLANAKVYILNQRLQPVPIGVQGELYIGGQGVACGYLNRPELTAKSFVPNPFSQGRLYKTGDRGCWQADGRIRFLGRIDDQIKLRGFRIEPGEIETLLLSHDHVRGAVVVSQKLQTDERLVAYVVADGAAKPTSDALRDHLRKQLPPHMIPSAFVWLDEMPLTPNGKVDRKRLSLRRIANSEQSNSFVPPRDRLEIRLSQIWQELLSVERIGLTENFFDLGGHSLIALRLVARIEKQLNVEIHLGELFQAPTIKELARLLRTRSAAELPSHLVGIRTEGSRRPFFCVHPAGGNVVCYGNLSRHLEADRPFYGLEYPGLRGQDERISRVEQLAAHHIAALRAHQPQGPYLLGGWSLGGLVAFEMARQLQWQGQQTDVLALFDSRVPINGRPNTDDDRVALFEGFVRSLPISADDLISKVRDVVQLDLEEQLRWVLSIGWKGGELPIDFDIDRLRHHFKVYEANFQAARRFVPKPYQGQVHLYCAMETPEESVRHVEAGWAQVAEGGVESHRVPGDHYTMLNEPHVRVLGDHLRQRLQSLNLDQ